MSLRTIQAAQFPDVEAKAAETPRPAFIEAPIAAMRVDEAYQRNLSERSRRLIKKLYEHWDWRAYKPPVAVLIGEEYHLIDGQHTAIAAASRGEVTLPIQLVEAGEVVGRAEAFVKHNRDRLNVTANQLHHALVAAGDEDALTIAQVCERAGARVLRNPPAKGVFEVGDVLGIGTLKGVVNRRYALGARRVLDVCMRARLAPISAVAMRAIEFILFSEEHVGEFADEDLADTLRLMGPAGAEREAKLQSAEFAVPLWRGLALALIRNTKRVRNGGHRKAS